MHLRIGTDPKVNKLDLFWYATEINHESTEVVEPDYIVVRDELIYFVEVKGTNKVKASDYYKIQEMNWKGQANTSK